MAINSKYMNRVFEGRWKVIEIVLDPKQERVNGYNLENIYNGQVIYVNRNSMAYINKGTYSVSKIIANKMKKVKRNKNCWNRDL